MKKFHKLLFVLATVSVIGISGIYVFVVFNQKPATLRLATTTSVDNTGLLDMLVEKFTAGRNIKVEILAKGTGAALQLARDGSVDAVIVHAPDLEKEFVNDGFGVNRTTLWYNYFLLVGPESDPAGAVNNESVGRSFSMIYNNSNFDHPFVSRGDGSGTHVKELQIWDSINLSVSTDLTWYLETGSGMSSTLRTASELEGYTISDLGTYTNFKDTLDLVPIFQSEDDLLYNPYSFIAVNPDKYSVNYDLSMEFRQFLLNSDDIVSSYRVNDEQLFIPLDR